VLLGPGAHEDEFTGHLAATLGVGLAAPQGHHDAVTALPPGATLLASSPRYPHQLFRVGERAWGLQYHPEVLAEDFEAWMVEDAAHLAAAGTSPAEVMQAFAAARDALLHSARAHADAFAGVVRRHTAGQHSDHLLTRC